MDDILPSFLILALIGAGASAWALDWAPFSNEVTGYPTMCVQGEEPHCRERRLLYPVEFRVHQDQQFVVGRWDGVLPKPWRMNECSVWDRDNWECRDGATWISAKDGDITIADETHVQFLPKWKWWWVRLSERKKPQGLPEGAPSD